jgi:hypothetical protein
MTFLVAVVFMLGSIAVAVLGFVSAKSDIQLIIGIMGVLFTGAFVVLGSIANVVADIRRNTEDALDQLENEAPKKRKASTSDFNDAMALYQKHTGHADVSAAIRALAADGLKREGFLR